MDGEYFKSHTSLIQSQIHQPVINSKHRLNEMCGSWISMGKILSKLKVHISLCGRKSYHITYLEDIRSRFDQFIPVFSHIEVCLPKKPPKPKTIGEGLIGLQRKFWKEALFLQYEKNKMSALFWLPYQSNTSLKEKIPLFTHCS